MAPPTLVSVIVPFFNARRTLDSTVSSILANSRGGISIEIIAVDDNSTDGSANKLIAYGDTIRLITMDSNVGVSAARNAGIDLARGEFIAFCDADDIWHPDKLMEQLPLFADHAVGLVCSDMNLIDTEGASIEKRWKTNLRRGWVYRDLLCHNFISTSSAVLRREVFRSERFNTSIRHAEDLDLWLRVAKHWKVDFVKKPLLQYRISPGQATKNWVALQESRLRVISNNTASLPLSLKRRAMAAAHFRYGMTCWQERDFPRARGQFLQAVMENPLSIRSWVRFGATALPGKLLGWILKIKGNIV